jgi:hypothetical protein
MDDPDEETSRLSSRLETKTEDDRGLDVPACMGLPTGRIVLHMGRDGLYAGSSTDGARRRTRIVLRDKVAGFYPIVPGYDSSVCNLLGYLQSDW